MADDFMDLPIGPEEPTRPESLDSSERDIFYRDCFSSVSGQEVLEDLLSRCPKSTFDPHSARQSDYNSGVYDTIAGICRMAGMTESDILRRKVEIIRHDG